MSIRITCPSCHHRFAQNEHTLYNQALSAADEWGAESRQDETKLLEEELHRLDDLIHHLNRERARLLQRINATRASTKHLSFELLSTIFQYVCPPIDFQVKSRRPWSRDLGAPSLEYDSERRNIGLRVEDSFQLVLGAVSSHWREVVWGIPQLWTTLSIKVSETTLQSNESLLNLHFQNSRALPMSIEIDLWYQTLLLDKTPDQDWRAKTISLLDPIKDSVLTKNAGKIHELILTGIPREWVAFIGKYLSRCQVFTILGTNRLWLRDHDNLSLENLPCLRHVRLKAISILPSLPCSTITVLELYRTLARICVELLVRCPNLVKFKNRDPIGDSTSPPSPRQSFIVEHLESLQWNDPRDSWGRAFLSFRFPRLKKLKWTGEHQSPLIEGYEEMRADFCDFFASLPATLEFFELSYSYYSFEELKDIFGNLHHIQKLRLKRSLRQINTLMVLGMIGLPVAGLDWDFSQGKCFIADQAAESRGAKILSTLETLVLDPLNDPISLDDIIDALETLEGARTTMACLRLELGWKVDWSLKTQRKVKELLARGFRLEIIEKSVLLEF